MAETEFPVKSLSGKTLFYLDKKTSGAVPYNNRLTIILRFSGLLLLLLFIHLVAESLAQKKRYGKAFCFLGMSPVRNPDADLFFPGLLNLRQFELFDPSIYGSNIIQRSLGDLLMNSSFFCWLVLFTWYKVQHEKDFLVRLPGWLKMGGRYIITLPAYLIPLLSFLLLSGAL